MCPAPHAHRHTGRLHSAQEGVALIEALVALVIMAFGMVAIMGLQGNMRRSADLAKQRGEAIRLAQQDMESARDYSVLALPAEPPEGVQAYDSLATAVLTPQLGAGFNTTFSITRTVTEFAEPAQKAIQVQVDWTDRVGEAQFIVIDSFVTRADPGLAGSLGIAPESAPTRRPGERHAAIPVAAKDLGDKTSVFKPQANGTVAWVFSNISGIITGKCMVPIGTPTSALTSADVDSCKNNTIGYLLSGFVRFSATTPADSDRPDSNALPLDMLLTLTSSGHALTPSYECFDDAPANASNEVNFVGYNCIVYPNNATPAIWSGKLTVSGIALGGDGWKICRYSADYDGNGTISNTEHPEIYNDVPGSLSRQNFLVIRASQTCPLGHTPDAPAGFFSNTATVLHQDQN